MLTLKLFISLVLMLLLPSCADFSGKKTPFITLGKLEFLDNQGTIFDKQRNIEIDTSGKLVATIKSNADLYQYKENRYVILTFDAFTCSKKIKITDYPFFIFEKSSDYSFFYKAILEYESRYGLSVYEHKKKPFNLANNPQRLCLRGRFSNMIGYKKTNTISFEIPNYLQEKIWAHYQKSLYYR